MTKLLPLLLLCLGLAGCDSVGEHVRDRFSEVPPKTFVCDADERTASFAVQLAFKRLDYHLTSTALLHVEAASAIHTSDAFGDARQLLAQVRLIPAGPKQTELEMTLIEEVEGASVGGHAQQTLREHGFFDTYFAMVQEVIKDGSAAAAAARK